MNSPVVNFVVCARNNREIISSTLEGIERQTVRDFTCTLVDGRSTDGTPELVRERFPWVEIVVKDKDTGPANSRNIGISPGSAKFVVILVNYELGNLLRYASVYLLLAFLDGSVYGPRKEKLGSLWWNVTHLADALRLRRRVQSHRRVRDKDLWPMFESGFRGPGMPCATGSKSCQRTQMSIQER